MFVDDRLHPLVAVRQDLLQEREKVFQRLWKYL
jgi:hypothetical protein